MPHELAHDPGAWAAPDSAKQATKYFWHAKRFRAVHPSYGGDTASLLTYVIQVCASGMKAVMLAAQSISLGHRRVMAAGGFESMSNTPYYLPKARKGLRLSHGSVLDGIIHDGLQDVYNDHHTGICAEKCS